MLPQFFVIGAQKSGTTSLHHYLLSHPDIYLPESKESHFFVDDEKYLKGLEFYQREYFGAWSGESVVGEVDPDYMYFPVVLERILTDIPSPQLKFILALRNPINRAYSHYLMSQRRGIEPLTFEDAIDAETDRLGKGFFEKEHYSYLDRGFYARQIERIFDLVDPEQVMFVLAEDLQSEPRREVMRCLRFLGLEAPDSWRLPAEEYHKGKRPRSVVFARLLRSMSEHGEWKHKLMPHAGVRRWVRKAIIKLNEAEAGQVEMTRSTREMLTERFQEDVRQLQGLIANDLAPWGWGKS